MCCNVMKSYVILLLAAVASVKGNSEVKERRSSYSCCEFPTFEFNEHDDTTWSTNNKTFAVSSGASRRCIPPCVKMEGGRMAVNECVNITAAVVSTDVNDVTVEERIDYYVQPRSDSPSNMMPPGNQGGSRAAGSAGLLLLALMIAGLNVK